jgi:hypothetical protein
MSAAITLTSGNNPAIFPDSVGIGGAALTAGGSAGKSLSIYAPGYPQLNWYSAAGATNEKFWRWIGRGSNDYELQTLDDSGGGEQPIIVTHRSGTTPTQIEFGPKASFYTALGWAASVPAGPTIPAVNDTGLSRDSADVVDCGNGTQGNKSCTFNAATGTFGTALTVAGNNVCQSTGTNCPVTGGSATVASAEVVSFSATPTFSVAFNASRIVLTGNITSFTMGAGSDGQSKQLCFKQGAGPYTVAPPANVHGFFTVGTTNATWSCQSFNYDNTDSIWLATSSGVVNE